MTDVNVAEPDFNDKILLTALRFLVSRLSKEKKISVEKQRELLAETGLSVSKDMFDRFKNGKNIKHETSVLVARHVHKYATSAYIDDFEAAMHEAILSTSSTNREITSSIHHLIAPSAPLDEQFLRDLRGNYDAYRIHFNDRSLIMKMSLVCCVDNKIDKFTLRSTHASRIGSNLNENVSGYIVPYDRKALFLGAIEGNVAPFLFILSNFTRAQGWWVSAEGAALAGAGSSLPYGSPILIIRTNEPSEPEVLSMKEIRDRHESRNFTEKHSSHPKPEWIESVLNRGEIKWENV